MTPQRSSFRVYYEDTDMAGVVYYANWFRFLERGRSDAVRAAGLSQRAMRDEDRLVFVVRRVEADYLQPARFDDVLTVETSLEAMRGASFVMPQRILRGDDVLMTARIGVACMSLDGRAMRIPAKIRHAFETLFA